MPDYRTFARQVAVDVGLDRDVFERQIGTESSFNPDAFNAGSGATEAHTHGSPADNIG